MIRAEALMHVLEYPISSVHFLLRDMMYLLLYSGNDDSRALLFLKLFICSICQNLSSHSIEAHLIKPHYCSVVFTHLDVSEMFEFQTL